MDTRVSLIFTNFFDTSRRSLFNPIQPIHLFATGVNKFKRLCFVNKLLSDENYKIFKYIIA